MAKDLSDPGFGRRPGSLLRARPWPFHPLLVGAYFVLFLYSVNLEWAFVTGTSQYTGHAQGLAQGRRTGAAQEPYADGITGAQVA